jgi:glycine/D-amino acid oxidase-like deaminating enzyme
VTTDRSVARITIIGGGFSGASTAVQLARRSSSPLAISIVELQFIVAIAEAVHHAN